MGDALQTRLFGKRILPGSHVGICQRSCSRDDEQRLLFFQRVAVRHVLRQVHVREEADADDLAIEHSLAVLVVPTLRADGRNGVGELDVRNVLHRFTRERRPTETVHFSGCRWRRMACR